MDRENGLVNSFHAPRVFTSSEEYGFLLLPIHEAVNRRLKRFLDCFVQWLCHGGGGVSVS